MFQKFRKPLSILALCLILMWAAIYASFQTNTVRHWALAKILAYVEDKTHAKVTIDHIELIFPLSLRIHHVNISFDEQPALLIGQLDLSILSPGLLKKQVTIQSIDAKDLFVGSSLLSNKNFSSNNENTTFPFAFNIKHLTLDNLKIDPKIATSFPVSPDISNLLNQSSFHLSGHIAFNESISSLKGHLKIIATSENNRYSPIQWTLITKNDQLSTALQIDRIPFQHLISSQKFESFVTISAEASGHTSTWINFLKGSPSVDSIDGHFDLTTKYAEIPVHLTTRYSLKSISDISLSDLILKIRNMTLNGEVSLKESQITTRLESNRLMIQDHEFNQIIANLEGNFGRDEVTAEIHVSSQYDAIPFMAQTQLNWNLSNLVHLDQLEINLLGSLLQGQIAINTSDSLFEGYLEGHQLQWEDFKTKELIISLHNKQSSLSLSALAKGFDSQNISANELLIDTQVNFLKEKWPCLLRAKIQDEIDFEAEGSWLFNSDTFTAQIDTASGHLKGPIFQLRQPLLLSYQKERTEISSLHLLIGEGELKGQIDLDHQNILLHCEATGIPSDIIQALMTDMPISGDVDFIADMKGPLDKPDLSIQAHIHDTKIQDPYFAKIPSTEADVKLTIADNELSFNGEVTGIGKNPVIANGKIPITFSLYPASVHLNRQLPVSFNLNAKGELTSFLHLFLSNTTNLTGETKIALGITGTLDAPNVTGQIDLINGSYEVLPTGLIYRNIQAHLEGDGSQLTLKSFSAIDDKNGNITATGLINLDATQFFPFEVQVNPTSISILDSDFSKISASGPLKLTGDLHGGKLAGSMQINQAIIDIGEETPTSVKSVDVTYINVPEGYKAPEYGKSSDNSWPLELDIRVNNSGGILIRGNNLKSEWKGDFIVGGTIQDILLNGDLRIVDGSFDLRGRVFNINQGNIHFAGPISKKTTLYIVASREIDTITAEIIVKGSTQNPVFSFRSNPPLSEREVLSYILFNRSTSDITPDQGLQLKQSFMELSAASGASDDFLTRMRNNIGLDRLDFSGGDNESDEFSLQLGKYISKGVLVGINKGLNAGPNRVTIEAELRKNLKAQAEVGDDGQGKLLLKWKKNY